MQIIRFEIYEVWGAGGLFREDQANKLWLHGEGGVGVGTGSGKIWCVRSRKGELKLTGR